MPVIQILLSKVYNNILEMKGWILVSLMAIYLIISWLLFKLAGENQLVSNITDFLYFAATTASTVGYGDMSPETKMGRLVAALWFFPGALLVFTTLLGKLSSLLIERTRKMADGLGDYSRIKNATVIIGYHSERTPLMIKNLIAGEDGDDKIIVLSRFSDISIPEGIRKLKAERLDALQSLKRAAVVHAEKILVYTDSDAETFNICLAIRELNENVHIAAYFQDRDTARRASRLAHIETVISGSIESLVRAAQDPGASRVLMAMATAGNNATIYSAVLEPDYECNAQSIERCLNKLDGSMIAYSEKQSDSIVFRPYPDFLPKECIIYYVAHCRLSSKQWQNIMETTRTG